MEKNFNKIREAVNFLIQEKSILYPTDTVWGLGCDSTSDIAVERVFLLKRRPKNKSFIVLVSNLRMLSVYVNDIPDKAVDIIKGSIRPTTIIYSKVKGLSSKLTKLDGSIAIRVVKDELCKKIITEFGKPIVSTSANISGEPFPTCYREINPYILNNVDYTVNLHLEKKLNRPSKILRIENDKLIVIRS